MPLAYGPPTTNDPLCAPCYAVAWRLFHEAAGKYEKKSNLSKGNKLVLK
jgi:hypothetical protein